MKLMIYRILQIAAFVGLGSVAACGSAGGSPAGLTYVPQNGVSAPSATKGGDGNSSLNSGNSNTTVMTGAPSSGVAVVPVGAANLCMSGTLNGAITLETCNGAAEQQWSLATGQLRNAGACLDTKGGALADGTPLTLDACASPVDRGQIWTVSGYIFDMASTVPFGPANQCIFPSSTGALAAGTALQIGNCTTLAVQWTVAPTGSVLMDSNDPNFCLSANQTTGVVSAAPCADLQMQRWSISGNTVQAVGLGNSCLSVASTTAGTPVTVADCNSTAAAQQWFYEGDDGSLRPDDSTGSCIDLADPNVTNSAIVLKACGSTTPGWKTASH